MTWFDGSRWCAFDTETTGKDPHEARLVTACVAFVGGGEPPEVMSWVADAGVDVPDEAAQVHGYTTDRVQAEGKPLVDVLPDVVGHLTAATAAGIPLVAFNAAYDNTVLDRETRRLGLVPFADTLTHAVVLDPLVIDKRVDRYRKGSRKLADCCTHYQVVLDGAHDAAYDALAAARVLYRIGQRATMPTRKVRALYADRRYPDSVARMFADLGGMTAAELHTAQVGWYAEQAVGLATYWRGQANERVHQAGLDCPPGDSGLGVDERREVLRQEAAELREQADGVSTHWPVRPYGGVS